MQRAYLIHALSPLHPGTGQAQGAIDLPIARLRGTNIPYLPGSSVKGVLRDACRPEDGMHREVFGPPAELGEDTNRFAGAVAFGDARLLALPVRSFHGTFAWVTSPLLLRLAKRDLAWSFDIPDFSREGRAGLTEDSVLAGGNHIFLEEVECQIEPNIQNQVKEWAVALGKLVWSDEIDIFTERFVVVDDETMTYLWECCTQVDARVRINKMGVVQKGALWYEESLPAETVLLGVAAVVKRDPDPKRFLEFCLGKECAILQFGGKATVGRGRSRLIPVMGDWK